MWGSLSGKASTWTKLMNATKHGGRWTHLLHKEINLETFRSKESMLVLERERERKGQKKNLGQKLGKFKRNFYQGYHKEAHKPNCGRCKPTQNLNRLFISDYQKIKIKHFYKEWNKAGENVKTDLHGHNPLRAVWSINPNPGALSEEYQESQK